MSSEKFVLEFGGEKHEFPLNGRMLTGDLIKEFYEQIAQQQKAQKEAQLLASASGGGAPADENVEDKNIIDTQENQEDALKAKNVTIEQSVQANFENVAEEKAKEKVSSPEISDIPFGNSQSIDSVVDEMAIDVSNSEMAQKIATHAFGAEIVNLGNIELAEMASEAQEEAYPIFGDNDYSPRFLDATTDEKTLEDEGILSRNVSKEEKNSDIFLNVEHQKEETQRTDSHHFSPVEELTKDEKTNDDGSSAVYLMDRPEKSDEMLGRDKVYGLEEKTPPLDEKSLSEQKTEEKQGLVKEAQKSKEDKGNQENKGKNKVGSKKMEGLLTLSLSREQAINMMKERAVKSGKKLPFKYSRLPDKNLTSQKLREASDKNNAALKRAQEVKRTR